MFDEVIETLKRGYGPNGSLSLRISEESDVHVQQIGFDVLSATDRSDPRGSLMIEFANALKSKTGGSGVTTFVLLATHLLQECIFLVRSGCPVSIVCRALDELSTTVLSYVREMSEPFNKEEHTSSLLACFLIGASPSPEVRNHLRSILLGYLSNHPVGSLSTLSVPGLPLLASRIFNGVIVSDFTLLSSSQPMRSGSRNILIFQNALKLNKERHVTALRTAESIQTAKDDNRNFIRKIVSVWTQSNVSLVLCSGEATTLLRDELNDNGIDVLTRVSGVDLRRIAAVSQAKILPSIEAFSPTAVGEVSSFLPCDVLGRECFWFSGSVASATFIIAGATHASSQQAQSVCVDALRSYSAVATPPSSCSYTGLVPGAGAWALRLASRLRQVSDGSADLKKVCDSYASACLSLPLALATNAGAAQPLALVTEAVLLHEQRESRMTGISLDGRLCVDVLSLGLRDPLVTVAAAVSASIEAVSVLIRVKQ